MPGCGEREAPPIVLEKEEQRENLLELMSKLNNEVS